MRNTRISAAGMASVLFLSGAINYPAPFAPPGNKQLKAKDETAGPFIETGQRGGRLLFAQRTEAKTLNPVTAIDVSSKQILGLLNADLIHIDRATQRTEPGLARNWTVSRDRRTYTLTLRTGLRFSDGQPFTVDDVLFSFQVYLDEKLHSPQRDLLIVGGKPIEVQKSGPDTVRFSLSAPYAAAERIFDSVFILPKHLLEKPYRAGELSQAWPVTVSVREIAGLGPFRLTQHIPGERLVLERNPYFWEHDSAGKPLPYLDELLALNSGGAEGEAMRFAAGEIDIADRLSAQNFATLERYEKARHLTLFDLGPGLEFDFLFFNLNGDKRDKSTLPDLETEACFRTLAFRRAVSTAIDRQALVRLAYRERAYPLSTFVPPGDNRWVNTRIPAWRYLPNLARQTLREAGFNWNRNGNLESAPGKELKFSLIFSASNPQQGEMATLIQRDLGNIGIQINIVPLEFHSVLERVFHTFDYEAAIMALAGGDTDPNSEINIWTSQGGTHVWDLTQKGPQAAWQKEVNRLMQEQMITAEYQKRKSMYDRVQYLVWENLPIICLISPHILVGAKEKVCNFRPAVLGDHILWNAERLYIRRGR